jgi:transcription elongation factor Elf1
MTVKSPLDDRRVQALLNKFMSGSIDALIPIFDLKRGFVYPDVEEIIGESEDAEKFLAMLVEAGVLKRELYDKAVHCPKCGSMNVSVQYCCPFCLSYDIKRSSLIEHIRCGYIDIEEKFVSGVELICPKCRRKLTVEDVDYRRAGLWCTCNKCGRSFDMPTPKHFCRNCQTSFTFENAKIKEAYKYRLNEDFVKTATSEWSILAPIRKLLEEKGFKVETPGFMEGRSGVKHMFDIIAYNNGRKSERLAINISTSPDGKQVPDHAVIDMFAKTYDSDIEKAILIAIPKISENGRKLANHYKICLIEAKTPEETIERIKETLKQNSRWIGNPF